eukprot:gene4013-2317_t
MGGAIWRTAYGDWVPRDAAHSNRHICPSITMPLTITVVPTLPKDP